MSGHRKASSSSTGPGTTAGQFGGKLLADFGAGVWLGEAGSARPGLALGGTGDGGTPAEPRYSRATASLANRPPPCLPRLRPRRAAR